MTLLRKKYLAPHIRQKLLFAAKAAVSGILAWWVLGRVNLSDSAERLSMLDLGWGVSALLCFVLLIVISGIRWFIFCHALSIKITIWKAIHINFIASFLGQILPAGLGVDAVRVWMLTRRNAKSGRSVSGVVLDRLTGLAALLLITTIFLPVLFTRVEDDRARIAIIILIAGGFFCFGFILLLSLIPTRLTRFNVMRKIALNIRIARRKGLSRRPALTSLVLSLILHIFSVIIIDLLANGLGIKIDFLSLLALIPPVMLLATLPVSIAGWGVREGAMVAALGYVGVLPGDALALSVLFGFITIIASIPGALLWLLQRRPERVTTKSS